MLLLSLTELLIVLLLTVNIFEVYVVETFMMLWANGRAYVNLIYFPKYLFVLESLSWIDMSVAATIVHRPEPTKARVEPTTSS